MITITEINNAIAKKLKAETGFPVYLPNVIENYITPCFFIGVDINGTSSGNINNLLVNLDAEIVYLDKLEGNRRVRDALETEAMIAKLFQMFAGGLTVKDRHLTLDNLRYTMTGEIRDVLNFGFKSHYYDDFITVHEDEPKEYIDGIDMNMSVNVK